MPQKSIYGGQAIIEGVMIRGRKNIAIAIRCPDDHIDLHTEPIRGIFAGWMKKVPLLRGFLTLLEMLVIGTRALMRSARLALDEDEEEQGSYSWLMWGTMVLGLVVGVGIFFVGPLFIQEWLDSYIDSSVLLNLIEGVIRLLLLLGYLLLIGTMKDIKRVFAYHGAEHMSIHALEHGDPLEVENVRKYSTLHPRCGTAFLLIVVLVSILVFVAVGQPALWIRIISRIVLLPAIAGLAYEVLKFHGAHSDNRLLSFLLAPGLALQRITTRRPDDAQIEVALAALKEAIAADNAEEEAAAPSPVAPVAQEVTARDPSSTD